MTNRIPKIIHYCWFGPGFMPRQHVECVKQWKRLMPNYKFMKWDESTFDVNMCEYTRSAYAAGKYAFVSDVARCWALYKYGGIYLDTDVQVFQSLDSYRNHGFFTAIEKFPAFESDGLSYLDSQYKPKDLTVNVPYFGVLSAVLGSVENHSLMAKLLSYYGVEAPCEVRIAEKQTGGGLFEVIDGVLARILVAYGFRYEDVEQNLKEDIKIYPTGIFGYACSVNPNYSVCYHNSLNSWTEKTPEEAKRLWLDRYYLLKPYDWYKKQKRQLKRVVYTLIKKSEAMQ